MPSTDQQYRHHDSTVHLCYGTSNKERSSHNHRGARRCNVQRHRPLVGRVFAARRLHPSARLLPKQDGRREINASGSRRCMFRCNTGCRSLILPCKASKFNRFEEDAGKDKSRQSMIYQLLVLYLSCTQGEEWSGTISKRTPLKMAIAITAPCQYHSTYERFSNAQPLPRSST